MCENWSDIICDSFKKREKREKKKNERNDQLIREFQDRDPLSHEILLGLFFSAHQLCSRVFFRPFYSRIKIIIRSFCVEIPIALNLFFSTWALSLVKSYNLFFPMQEETIVCGSRQWSDSLVRWFEFFFKYAFKICIR